MKVWIVFVKVRFGKNLAARYIDSQWATKSSASSRKSELEASFAMFGCAGIETGAVCDIYEGAVTDTKIIEKVDNEPAKG